MRRWRQLGSGVAIGILASGQAEPPALPVTVKSEALCRIVGERTSHFRLVTNADLSQVAAIDTWDPGKWYVSVNSAVWEFYTDIDAASAQFSSDGKHLSLLAQHGQGWFLITDDTDVRNFGPAACRDLVLSRDGKHDACLQATPNGWRVLADGRAVAVEGWNDFTQIAGLLMTPESQVAFVGRAGKKAVMVLDGKVLGIADADLVTAPGLSPDGKQLAYSAFLATDNGQSVARIVNGYQSNRWPVGKETSVSALAISPDGQHVVWAESDEGGARVIIDGISRDSHVGPVDQIILSPDSKHFAWSGTHGPVPNRRYAEADGQRFMLDPGLDTQPLTFSSDSHNLHCLGPTARFDCCLEPKGWRADYAMTSADGQLRIRVGGIWVSALDAHGDYAFSEKGSLLDLKASDSNSAYVLTETPRAVQANGQKINVVTRFELKWTGK